MVVDITDVWIIKLIDKLFELDEDKNDNLSDLERYQYGKIRDKLIKG